ncbi:V-type H(+)-translocating pyrophosphatase [Candidatus Geothermarchaeota archaeon ex4572_27]|nr:MAG: V-type H(+)-translocating pyrophosphatase [Candidatus Geothermarchaeota archaeon ex4572_27]
MDPYIVLIPLSVVLAIAASAYLIYYISRKPSGTPKMIDIHKGIREGAEAYLKRQYKAVLSLLTVIAVLIYMAIDYHHNHGIPFVSASFMMGTIASLIAGWVSMDAATRANVKVAEAARKSQAEPLKIAFYGGLVLGLMIVAMSLAGVAGLFFLYLWIAGWDKLVRIPELVMGFGFGASLAALFMQLGGGIYTKAADVGADLVGKVEVGIPEDDPRNPAVIADNVGDNVGDCAGRGADLFESISAENIGSMIIGASLYLAAAQAGLVEFNPLYLILYPVVIRAAGLLATLIGALFVRPKEPKVPSHSSPNPNPNPSSVAVVEEVKREVLINPVASLRNGLIASTIIIAVIFYFITLGMLGPASVYIYYATLVGLAAALAIEVITEYYTGEHRPVKSIVEASKTGPATNIHMGMSVGMESTALPVIAVSIALLVSYILGRMWAVEIGIDPHTGGVYGTAAATMGMLSLTGIILAMDGYGPIADNAGGIIEMSGIEDEVGPTSDVLDAAGNTTKALAKGFAMGSAAMAALLLFQAYVDVIKLAGVELAFDLTRPDILIGLIIGGMVPYLFSALAIRAVGKASYDMINEVRRQFREKPEILEWKARPDYARCVDISTRAAQREMIAPSMLALISPIAVGFLLGPMAAGAFLIGVTVSGLMLAFFLNNGGAAWDNAKKMLERVGLKGTDQHKAAVVGDTVGDPAKDTAGPSIHILLKLVNNVAIVFAALFVLYALSVI